MEVKNDKYKVSNVNMTDTNGKEFNVHIVKGGEGSDEPWKQIDSVVSDKFLNTGHSIHWYYDQNMNNPYIAMIITDDLNQVTWNIDDGYNFVKQAKLTTENSNFEICAFYVPSLNKKDYLFQLNNAIDEYLKYEQDHIKFVGYRFNDFSLVLVAKHLETLSFEWCD